MLCRSWTSIEQVLDKYWTRVEQKVFERRERISQQTILSHLHGNHYQGSTTPRKVLQTHCRSLACILAFLWHKKTKIKLSFEDLYKSRRSYLTEIKWRNNKTKFKRNFRKNVLKKWATSKWCHTFLVRHCGIDINLILKTRTRASLVKITREHHRNEFRAHRTIFIRRLECKYGPVKR